MCCLHVLPVSVWVLVQVLQFPPTQSETTSGDSKSPLEASELCASCNKLVICAGCITAFHAVVLERRWMYLVERPFPIIDNITNSSAYNCKHLKFLSAPHRRKTLELYTYKQHESFCPPTLGISNLLYSSKRTNDIIYFTWMHDKIWLSL